jgi:hypothetical protein
MNGDSAKSAYDQLIRKREKILTYYRQLESNYVKNTFETSVEFEKRKATALNDKRNEINEKLSLIEAQLSLYNNCTYLLRSNRFRITLAEKDYNADVSMWKMKIMDNSINNISYAKVSINPTYAKELWKLKDKVVIRQIADFSNPQKVLVLIDFPQSLFFNRLFFQLNVSKYNVNKSVQSNKFFDNYKSGGFKVVETASKIKSTPKSYTLKIYTSSDDPTDELVKTSKEKIKGVMGKYQGGNGKGGNNQDSYNVVKDQGIAGGKGDTGLAKGKIDGKSYTGKRGLFVTMGDRKIVKVYSFNEDVEAATIYAEIEVSPSGVGKFIQIVKGSSSNDAKYKSAIKEYLKKISFNVSDHSSVVTVKFKFEVQ